MEMTKEDYLTRIDTMLQDEAEKLQPDDKDRFLSQAVSMYSKDRPRELIHEITGDASAYDFSLPSDWVAGFSGLVSRVEYPADDYQNPIYIEEDEWDFFKKLVNDVTTTYFRFTTFTPANGKIARFLYTVPHTLNESTNTITDNDIDAVVNLTAALCFWALAAKFAQTIDPVIDADVIDYQRKTDLYTSLAKDKLAIYNSLMGIGEEAKGSAAATAGVAVKDLDIAFPWGEDYLTHPMRQR